MSNVVTNTTAVPSWLAEMEFCHIDDGSGTRSYCGQRGGVIDCDGEYDGEAICRGCGLPNCPRCCQLCDLEERALDA